MTELIEEKYLESDLGQMNPFVIPVTSKLLTEPSRAMDSDFRYAKEKNIPVLPMVTSLQQNSPTSRPIPAATNLRTASFMPKPQTYTKLFIKQICVSSVRMTKKPSNASNVSRSTLTRRNILIGRSSFSKNYIRLNASQAVRTATKSE